MPLILQHQRLGLLLDEFLHALLQALPDELGASEGEGYRLCGAQQVGETATVETTKAMLSDYGSAWRWSRLVGTSVCLYVYVY